MLKAEMTGKFLGFMNCKSVIAQGKDLMLIRSYSDADNVFKGNQYRTFRMTLGINSSGDAVISEAELLEDSDEVAL